MREPSSDGRLGNQRFKACTDIGKVVLEQVDRRCAVLVGLSPVAPSIDRRLPFFRQTVSLGQKGVQFTWTRAASVKQALFMLQFSPGPQAECATRPNSTPADRRLHQAGRTLLRLPGVPCTTCALRKSAKAKEPESSRWGIGGQPRPKARAERLELQRHAESQGESPQFRLAWWGRWRTQVGDAPQTSARQRTCVDGSIHGQALHTIILLCI